MARQRTISGVIPVRGANLFSRVTRGLVAAAVVTASLTTGAILAPSSAARTAGPEALILTGPADRTADPTWG